MTRFLYSFLTENDSPGSYEDILNQIYIPPPPETEGKLYGFSYITWKVVIYDTDTNHNYKALIWSGGNFFYIKYVNIFTPYLKQLYITKNRLGFI